MISFRPVELADKEAVDHYFSANNSRITEGTFIDLFIWRGKYYTEICIEDGFLYASIMMDGEQYYMCPAGFGDFGVALERLMQHCRERGETLQFATLAEEDCKRIEAAAPGRFVFTDDRDRADYLYLSESMITLAGKKLHGKRNFINRFKQENEGRWVFHPIRTQDLDELYSYEKHWKRENRTSEGDLDAENYTINVLLDNMDALGAVGGILRLDGRVIGFSIGAPVGTDTFDIMIEKAEWEIAGAYQVLFNEFAKTYCGNYMYINREDDMGIEGLRKAKMSYRPIEIMMKYKAREATHD